MSSKRLVILGSTGSVGRQTLDVVRALPDNFRVLGLAAGKNLELLAEQINEFKPEFVFFQGGPSCPASAAVLNWYSMEEMSAYPEADIVVIAASGGAGLSPTLAAVRARKKIALSNKESLVAAGEIIMREVKRWNPRKSCR